jgi:uroporphyrin-III C-methyltransferase
VSSTTPPTETPAAPVDVQAAAAAPAALPPAPPEVVAPAAGNVARWLPAVALVLGLGALAWSFNLHQRLRATEEEFARRQQESAALVIEARTLSKQAEAVSRDMAAKLALLEARVAESSMQRTQLEELMQSLSRSRDENVLADIEAALRVAQQQAAITGSADPLVITLKQTDERLSRMQQPRLERVRRAAIKDLERVRAAGSVDVTTLTLKLDEVTRQVDELPLISAHSGVPNRDPVPSPSPASAAARAAQPASGAAAPVRDALAPLRELAGHVWSEARGLIRVTRIDRPEAALLAPEQALFLRENLRLRLLNARLSLLSRQFDAAQLDLRQAQSLLDRYFDRSSRRVLAASELLKQTAAQSRSVVLPVPEATLAALSAAAAGR